MRQLSMISGLLALTLVGCSGGDSSSTTSPSGPSPTPSSTTTTTTLSVPVAAAYEVPPISNAEANVTGTATITLRTTKDAGGAVTAATADFQVALTGLTQTSTLTAAHIHRGASGTNGGVLVNTGLTTTNSVSFSQTGINVAADVATQILADPSAFYFNVHTALNPGGVARGQLSGTSQVAPGSGDTPAPY